MRILFNGTLSIPILLYYVHKENVIPPLKVGSSIVILNYTTPSFGGRNVPLPSYGDWGVATQGMLLLM